MLQCAHTKIKNEQYKNLKKYVYINKKEKKRKQANNKTKGSSFI